MKAEAVVKPQKVYIIDMVKGNLRAYNVKKVIVDNFIEEIEATLISSTSEENTSYNNLKASRASNISSVVNDYPSNNINYSHLLSSEPLSYDSSEITAYQFIQDSSKRRDVYRRMQVAYPTLMNLTNSWNKFVTVMSINLTSRIALSANLNAFTYQPKIVFPDGAYVIVKHIPDTESYEVISAVDIAGNDIPLTSQSSISGTYSTSSSEHYNQFTQYLGNWGAIHYGNFNPSLQCGTTCVRGATNGVWSCTIKCN